MSNKLGSIYGSYENNKKIINIDSDITKISGSLDLTDFGLSYDSSYVSINSLKTDYITNKTDGSGVTIGGAIKILGSNLTNANSITASNYYVGSRNVISGSAQGSFTDLELKNNNGTKLLIDGDTGDITAHGTLSIDNITRRINTNGVEIESVKIYGTTVNALNYNVGTRNVISASAQGSFTDLELKNNNGTKLLIDGDTGDITGHGTLSIDNINEKTSASGVTIGSDLIVDTIKGGSTMIIDPAAHNNNTGKLVIKGDLEVQGDTTSINSTIIELSDNRIKLNAAASTDAGIDISFSDGTSKSFYYSKSDVQWKTDNTSLNIGSGTITAATLSGNAATATQLANARTIGGVLFDGTANIDLPGVNQVGNQNTSGNAATATKLANARTIGGVSFDGTANINLPGVNQVGNQNTSGNAATATKLANARTINNISFDGTQNIVIPIPDSLPDQSGNNGKLLISDGSNATWSSDISVNNIDISVNLKVNNISEKTNGSGITIDNVLIKDNTITTNGSDSKMTINNLNSNNDGTQNTYSETEINSKLSDIIWCPYQGNTYGNDNADFDTSPDGFSGTWTNNLVNSYDRSIGSSIYLPAHNGNPDRLRVFARSSVYRDFDLENFKWMGTNYSTFTSAHGDFGKNVYNEQYDRYLIIEHSRIGREGQYVGGFTEINRDLSIFQSTRYLNNNSSEDKAFIDITLNKNNNKAYCTIIYGSADPWLDPSNSMLGIYNFADRSITFNTTAGLTMGTNAPTNIPNYHLNMLTRLCYISTLDKFIFLNYSGALDNMQLVDSEENNFTFIKVFSRAEIFSDTTLSWPKTSDPSNPYTFNILNHALDSDGNPGFTIYNIQFVEDLNVLACLGKVNDRNTFIMFLEVTNTGFGNYNIIPIGNDNATSLWFKSHHLLWIPELKRFTFMVINKEYKLSSTSFSHDSAYNNMLTIDLVYNNIPLTTSNIFNITSADFSIKFGYQTSPYAIHGANGSHNYGGAMIWIPKYGTLFGSVGGLRDPITNSNQVSYYFLNRPTTNMTIPYSTTTSRVFNIENNVDISGNITAIKFYGDGSNLTGIDALPDQSGNSGKLLISDGSNAIWSSDINDGLKISGAIYDNTNNKGTNGQVLQSNGTTWNWATPITSNDISNAIAALVDSAPSTLNTLNELAAALGDDTNFSTTITNSLATKLNIANSHDITNVTAGTVRASSAVVVDANKDITGYRNVTATAFYGDGSNLTGISSVTSLDDLSDCKVEGTNFTESIKIGSSTTGSLNNARFNTIIGIGSGNNISSGNHTTLLGHQAGQNLTTGSENTFIGVDAGQMATTSNWNTCIGGHAADQLVGNQNTIVGRSTARQLNGNWVTCLGAGAGRYMNDSTPSEHVTVIGARCGYDIRGVSNCVILGAGPLTGAAAISDWSNGHGSNTVTIGMNAITNTYLKGNIHIGSNTDGSSNVVYTLPGTAGTSGQILKFPSSTTTVNNNATYLLEWGDVGGVTSLDGLSDCKVEGTDFTESIKIGSSTTGSLSNASNNTIIGIGSGDEITSGTHNTMVGTSSGLKFTNGIENTFIGSHSGPQETSTACNFNTCLGSHTGNKLNGTFNTLVGRECARYIEGDYNTVMGCYAGFYMQKQGSTTTQYNTVIGSNCGFTSSIKGRKHSVILGAGNPNGEVWADGHGSNTVTIGMDAISDTYLKGNINIGTSTIGNSNVVYTLPGTAGTSGQILKYPSSGSTLEWATPITSNDISNAIAALVDSAPSTLNTLNELAAALGDDANFSTTITNQLSTINTTLNVTPGTVTASKAVVVDANKDISGFRNVNAANNITASAFYGDGSNLTGIDALPSQSGNSGKLLISDGTNATWSNEIHFDNSLNKLTLNTSEGSEGSWTLNSNFTQAPIQGNTYTSQTHKSTSDGNTVIIGLRGERYSLTVDSNNVISGHTNNRGNSGIDGGAVYVIEKDYTLNSWKLKGQIFYGLYKWLLGSTVAISDDGNRIFFSFGGPHHWNSSGASSDIDSNIHSWSSATNDVYQPGAPLYPEQRYNRTLGYVWDPTINKYKRFYTFIASTETDDLYDSGLHCNSSGTRIIIGNGRNFNNKGRVTVFNQDPSDINNWSKLGTFGGNDYISSSVNSGRVGLDVGIAKNNDNIICFTQYKSFYNSSDVNSDTVNRLDPYGKKLQDHASGTTTHKIFKLNTSSNVWEQMSFGEFYAPKFDRRFIPGRFDSHGELGVSPASSEISADGLTFLYMFLGGFAWSKYENDRWCDPYYYFFPVSNPPSSRNTPNWVSLNNDRTNMSSSNANYLVLPESYRPTVTNIDQYYYPDEFQATESTGHVHLSGNGKYIVAHNDTQSTPFSEDTNSSSANDYLPGPWISLYKLENNTTSWIAGLENLGNNTFLTTYNPNEADQTVAMSHDGMKIIITRGGWSINYGKIDGQSDGRYGALVSLENTTQTSGITSSLSVSNITATNLNVSGDISAIKYYGDGSNLTGIDALPDQSGNNGKLLISDGSNATWSSDISVNNIDVSGNILTKGIIKFSVTNNVLVSEDPSGIIHRLDTLDNSVNTLKDENTLLKSKLNEILSEMGKQTI